MSLVPAEYQGQRILTTALLAEAYGTDRQNISYNYNSNKSRFTLGKHYFVLEGEVKKEFLDRHEIHDGSKNASHLYLWTEKGAWLHAKSLNTDNAWDAYEALVDDYFVKKERLIHATNELESLRETMRVANESASLLSGLIESAGLNPEIKLLTTKVIYRHLGIDLPIEIKMESKLYDTKQIAKSLGMFTENNNPAYHAVGAIIRKLEIDESEKQIVLESSGAWQGTVVKYSESVIGKVKNWLEIHRYPETIQTTTDNGSPKNYKVKFLAS